MTGYKVLHLGPDGVFRSPYVLNFTVFRSRKPLQ